jgi:hypothetical protein
MDSSRDFQSIGVISLIISLHLIRPVVFIHYPYSIPHPLQMGRVWLENNYPLKKLGG